VAAIAPSATLAQAAIRGFVYDDSTGVRLAAAAVMLIDPATDAAVVNAKTDSLGQFSLKVKRGIYQIVAVREGYANVVSAPITLIDGESMTLRIPIATTGYPVHKIGVLEHEGRQASQARASVDGRLSGFEQRRRSSTGGLQYDRAKLEQSPATTVGDFLSMVPGVSVRGNGFGGAVQMRRSGVGDDGVIGGVVSPCRVGWFLDGTRMDRPGMSDAFTQGFTTTRLSDVEALEVFRGLSEMPAEFAAPDLRCGAVVLWTRR
jgi:hypothetical protein